MTDKHGQPSIRDADVVKSEEPVFLEVAQHYYDSGNQVLDSAELDQAALTTSEVSLVVNLYMLTLELCCKQLLSELMSGSTDWDDFPIPIGEIWIKVFELVASTDQGEDITATEGLRMQKLIDRLYRVLDHIEALEQEARREADNALDVNFDWLKEIYDIKREMSWFKNVYPRWRL